MSWRSVRVGDLVEAGALLVSDGYRVTNRELGTSGVPFVRGGDIRDGWIDARVMDHVRDEFRDRIVAKLSQAEDVAFITKGDVGRVGFLRPHQPQVVFAPQVSYWRVLDREVLEPRFLYYLLKGGKFQASLDAVKTHGSMLADYVSLSDQRSFYLSLPPVQEQRAIATLLGALDDKIDLNRRMNQTLEAIARAIFKSWFVDFEPVREGRDGFPSGFSESPLGLIPKGWAAESAYHVADVLYGAPFSSTLFSEGGLGRPLMRIRDLVSQAPSVFTTEVHPKGFVAKAGDLVVGMDGEFRIHLWRGPESLVNQRVCMFRPKPSVPKAFVRFSVERPLDFFERSKVGTTVIHLGKADIDRFRLVVPGRDVLKSFGALTDPLFDRIVANDAESRTLVTLRDTLLPKLLSGEIRVKQAEKLVGEAV